MDTALFHLLNTGFTAPPLDWLVYAVSHKAVFAVVGGAIGAAAFIRGTGETRRMIVALATAVVLSDVAVLILKDLFARVRPCHALEGVRVLAGCSDSYSLPSRHTTDMFAIMTFLSLRFRRWAPALLAAALLVGYSRVYAGAHYPGDVAAGALLGAAAALVVDRLDRGVAEGALFKRRRERGEA
ncbi:MAG: phosphatase PAP2 family protein [Thermodesulfobacteriota bacterium]